MAKKPKAASFEKIKELKAALKAAGYKPRLDWHDEKEGDYGITAYNAQRGVGITMNTRVYNPQQPCSSGITAYGILLRSRGQYQPYQERAHGWRHMCHKTLEDVLEAAKELIGAGPIEKAETAKSRLSRLRSPKTGGNQLVDKIRNVKVNPTLVRSCVILKAEVQGLCRIDSTGSIVTKNIEEPSSDTFFMVNCYDVRDRRFFIILNDFDGFYVAMKRGGFTTKLVDADTIFTTGPYPLDLYDITVEDLEFVLEAIDIWTQSL